MEIEKRKRGEKEEREREGEGRKKVREEVGSKEGTVVPTEEEVEEFFAILRRMKVAVKYFEKEGNAEGWRAALETEEEEVVAGGGEEAVVIDDDDVEKNGILMMKRGDRDRDRDRHEGVEENGVLDLNAAAPEEGEGNDA